MSRSLASDILAEKDKLFSRPFPSAVFHFGGSVGDIYLSEFDALIAGVKHVGCVETWGEYGALSQLLDGMFSTDSMRLRIINHPLFGSPKKRFTDLWAGLGVEGIEVDVYQNFLKTDAPGTILQALMFAGVMRPQSYWPDLCEIELAPISEKYLNFEISFPIDQTDFPNADVDDVGKRANQIYGSLKKVRCHAVVAGPNSVVRATMGTSDTTVPIWDDFYDIVPSSGTVIVGNEKIAYTSKSGAAGARVLGGLTRGSGSTPIESHLKDDVIMQLLNSYIYLVAGHPMVAVDAVYVEYRGKQIPLAPSQYTVNLNNTTLVSGRNLTTITFTSPPLIATKDGASIVDSIGVNDGIGVSDGIGVNDTIGISQSLTETTWTQNTADQSGSQVNVALGATDIAVNFNAQNKTKSSGNFEEQITFRINSITVVPSAVFSVGVVDGNNVEQTIITSGTVGGSATANMIASVYGGIRIRLHTTSNAGYTLGYYIGGKSASYLVSNTVSKTGAATKTGSASKTGSATKTGTVSLSSISSAEKIIGDAILVTGRGYADDGSGTYTGTPNALIEKPADVMHHLARFVSSVPSNRIDAASFQAARADAPSSHKFGGNLIERSSNLKTLMLALGIQSRIKIDWPADKLIARFLKTSYGSPLKTITRDQIGATKSADGIETTLRLSHTPVEDLVNVVNLYYGRRDWGVSNRQDSFTKISKTSDATSITKYRTREQKDRFLFDFIADNNSAMADDLRDFWLARLKEPARVAEFEAFLDQLELLPGDLVALDYLVGASEKFDNLAGANKFLLEELKISPQTPARGQAPMVRLKFREVS